MTGWDTLEGLLRSEVIQRKEEGVNIDGYEALIEEAHGDRERLLALYQQLMRLPIPADYPFSEPMELAHIQAERPTEGLSSSDVPSREIEQDSFYGALLGRCIGCALGKPLEGGPFSGTKETPGWLAVARWFQGADAWPIAGYTPSHSKAEQEFGYALNSWSKESERDHIQYMQGDDDVSYTLLGLLILERFGTSFTTYDIGIQWHLHLPYASVCTAERQAYLNFALTHSLLEDGVDGVPADWLTRIRWGREYLNPYREWIGAQIRADPWGYAAAGRPAFAAELAYRDASFSHVKNGVYGAMYMAAMIAAAFVESDPERLVQIGLREIPQSCRLAFAIKEAVSIAQNAPDPLSLVQQLWNAFHHYSWVHTINNAALVTAALVFARGDFQVAITTAVLGGWDTDCNGATVGSILGAICGTQGILDHWKEPLHDTLYASFAGFSPGAISTCAQRFYSIYRTLLKE